MIEGVFRGIASVFSHTEKMRKVLVGLVFFSASLPMQASQAEVVAVSEHGFVSAHSATVPLDPNEVYRRMIEEVDQWWSAAHTYTQNGKNLSFDLQRGWFLEALPQNGYVRHMDIVMHRPGSQLRLAGGLGPLQQLGVAGALTITLTSKDEKTQIQWSYHVSGYTPTGLEKFAEPVDQVNGLFLAGLVRHCQQAGETLKTPSQKQD